MRDDRLGWVGLSLISFLGIEIFFLYIFSCFDVLLFSGCLLAVSLLELVLTVVIEL